MEKLIDWNKPVQRCTNVSGLIDVEVLKILPSGSAVLGWHDPVLPTRYLAIVADFNSPNFRNKPEPPKLLAWTREEVLKHWNDAFRRQGSTSIVRLNICDSFIAVGGRNITEEHLKDMYTWTATPWDDNSWQPCGKLEEK